MIKGFKHKGLEKLFLTGSTAGVQSAHKDKLRIRLAMLEAAEVVQDMDKPGWSLHQLKGSRSELWAVAVSGDWRLTFLFKNGDAHAVNYEDYH